MALTRFGLSSGTWIHSEPPTGNDGSVWEHGQVRPPPALLTNLDKLKTNLGGFNGYLILTNKPRQMRQVQVMVSDQGLTFALISWPKFTQ